MLAAIGVDTIDELFGAVPATHRFPKLDLPPPLSEMEVAAEMLAISEANDHAQDFAIFRGAGAYHHFIPSVVNHMLLRGEFYTAYTPYQPEISQGTLQATYEYQSMMCALTGMDAANASHYDGATSLAEAVTVALEVARHKRKKGHPQPRHPSAIPRSRTHVPPGARHPHHRRPRARRNRRLDGDARRQYRYARRCNIRTSSARLKTWRRSPMRCMMPARLLVMVANPMALVNFQEPGRARR